MWYYRIYGLNIASDFAIKEAFSVDKPVTVDVSVCDKELGREYVEITEEEIQSGCTYSVFYEQERICMRQKGQGAFIMCQGSEIAYSLYDTYDREMVEEILLYYCMPLIALQRKIILIHGSGIYYDEKALIISGESGSGKSSLTNEIMQRGYLQMADDTVAVNQEQGELFAYAAFPVRKLCDDVVERMQLEKEKLKKIQDTERDKYVLRIEQDYYAGKARLGAMIIIQPGETASVQMQELTGAEKLRMLMKNLFTKQIYQRIKYPKESYIKNVMIANSMPMYVLTRPQGKLTVKEQADLVEELIMKNKG